MKGKWENKMGLLGSSLGLLVSNWEMWENMMDLSDCNLGLMALSLVMEHMQDWKVNSLVTYRLLGLECTDSLLDQEKMDFQVVGSKENSLVIDHLHHWHLTVKSLVRRESNHCPTLKHERTYCNILCQHNHHSCILQV